MVEAGGRLATALLNQVLNDYRYVLLFDRSPWSTDLLRCTQCLNMIQLVCKVPSLNTASNLLKAVVLLLKISLPLQISGQLAGGTACTAL